MKTKALKKVTSKINKKIIEIKFGDNEKMITFAHALQNKATGYLK